MDGQDNSFVGHLNTTKKDRDTDNTAQDHTTVNKHSESYYLTSQRA